MSYLFTIITSFIVGFILYLLFPKFTSFLFGVKNDSDNLNEFNLEKNSEKYKNTKEYIKEKDAGSIKVENIIIKNKMNATDEYLKGKNEKISSKTEPVLEDDHRESSNTLNESLEKLIVANSILYAQTIASYLFNKENEFFIDYPNNINRSQFLEITDLLVKDYFIRLETLKDKIAFEKINKKELLKLVINTLDIEEGEICNFLINENMSEKKLINIAERMNATYDLIREILGSETDRSVYTRIASIAFKDTSISLAIKLAL